MGGLVRWLPPDADVWGLLLRKDLFKLRRSISARINSPIADRERWVVKVDGLKMDRSYYDLG
jgi:hypothetical protein